MAQSQVPPEYEQSMVDYVTYIYGAELWAGNCAAYWMTEVPMEPEFHEYRVRLGKMAYDEVRHADICRRMAQHFGGDEAIESHDEQLRNMNWDEELYGQLTYCHTRGPDSFIEFLPTVPLTADATAQASFARRAEATPDPLWSDAAESIAQDERQHGSISMDAIPLAIELYGDEAKEQLQRGLDRFALTTFSLMCNRPMDSDSWLDTQTNEEAFELMMGNLHDVFDPYPAIELPEFTMDDWIPLAQLGDYAVKVANNPSITYHNTVL